MASTWASDKSRMPWPLGTSGMTITCGLVNQGLLWVLAAINRSKIYTSITAKLVLLEGVHIEEMVQDEVPKRLANVLCRVLVEKTRVMGQRTYYCSPSCCLQNIQCCRKYYYI